MKKKVKISIYIDKKGEYRWRVFSSNGRNLANSGEGYRRISDCKKIIKKLFIVELPYELFTIKN